MHTTPKSLTPDLCVGDLRDRVEAPKALAALRRNGAVGFSHLAVVVNYAGNIARTRLFMCIQVAPLSEYASNHCLIRAAREARLTRR